MNTARLEASLHEINQIGGSPGEGNTRLAYTKEHWAANDYFIKKCRDEGMSIRIDACGNVIARLEGIEPDLPAVACGSHLDTVQQGGRYDGTLGVLAGLEIIRTLNENGILTRRSIEIISFACEESARFGVSTIGSKAMAGKLEKLPLEQLYDKDGISFPEALASVGLNVERIGRARRSGNELRAFFELHIEQGPLLERIEKQVGIATGIAAPTRLEVIIQGKASHSGTTPMKMRKDALVGAAEIVTGLEKAALAEAQYGTVATTGVCNVRPGAMNVIPDSVHLQMEIRGTVKESKKAVLEYLLRLFQELERSRGLMISSRILSHEDPVLLDGQMVRFLSSQCDNQGITYVNMVSGAGHDAMNMASLCPTGLIFIPSHDGVSHHKDECSTIEQIDKGAFLLKESVLQCAEIVQR
ncbi:Zn-dependent hydrolase [Paenibacillus beijingensis]|uniref:N-carbamoyl-L-amino acid amidohydrolase n=1 Tax=Paenibacillus beijingensis TaxID=1126833 RepID=A0A0D5NEI1_9BACL|nr:Zn-dependent hydrolase [Paenibacillus beijingensis]AJY73328.1 N-carbamoyl-L-amino acid amidohydrolase [Paenibacillus beijingensis]